MDKNKIIITFDQEFWKWAKRFGYLVILICFIPIIVTKSPFYIQFPENSNNIGDTIGGIMGPFVGLAAAALTFLAFWIQYKANEQQKLDIKEQKAQANKNGLESRLMEMVKMHRENVSELTFTAYSKIRDINTGNYFLEKETAHSRKVFKVVFEQVKSLNSETSFLFDIQTENSIYEEPYLLFLKNKYSFIKLYPNFVSLAKADIIYSIVYFGLSTEDKVTLENHFKDKYKKSFYRLVIKVASIKPKVESLFWNRWENFNKLTIEDKKPYIDNWTEDLNESINFSFGTTFSSDLFYHDLTSTDNYTKYYGGHQFRLGHYFRNLFQAVNLIDKSRLLSFQEKYINVKLIRAQLSNYEQIIFFLNSISILGRTWELEPKLQSESIIPERNWLITRYNLIKNIVKNEVIEGVLVTDYYPLVTYEANFLPDLNQKREELRNQYLREKAQSEDSG